MNRATAFAAHAPLMSIPGAAPPFGGEGEWYRGAGGLRLRAAFWPAPGPDVRGTVVLSFGRTEPIEKYYELISDFLGRDFAVLAHDWRGQGLSARLMPDRLKGHARAAEEQLDDFQRLLEHFAARMPEPWIMVGHSMGAALNLMTLEGGETRFAGAVLSSPMLRIRTGRRSLWSTRLAARWAVRHGRASDYVEAAYEDPFDPLVDDKRLTNDMERYERWREQLFACPHLAVGSVTWGWLAFALDIGDRVLKPRALKAIHTPVTIVQAAEDRIVWKQTARWAAKRITGVRYVEVAGALHEIWIETDDKRLVFLREFDAMADRVAPDPYEAPAEPVAAVDEDAPEWESDPAPDPIAAEAEPERPLSLDD